jgi:hypothetical protein
MEFVCRECNKSFSSKLGLGNHISNSYNKKDYYDKWIRKYGENICPICSGKNEFRSLRDGYTKTCKKCSNKIRFPSRKEYWIYRGYTEDQADKKVIESQKEKSDKVKKHHNNATMDYWLKKGYSKLEAIEKIRKRQSTFSKNLCIEKYGEIDGLKKWRARQVNWQKTLHDKSIEELKRINKLKGVTLENMIRKWGEIDGTEKYNDWKLTLGGRGKSVSNISQKLFFSILENIIDKNNVKFEKHQKKFYIKEDKKFYYYDFKYHNKIIEFNGDLFHANPLLYNSEEYPNFYYPNLTSKEIWKTDKIKLEKLDNIDMRYLIIWESEFKKDPDEILKKCLNFLNSGE